MNGLTLVELKILAYLDAGAVHGYGINMKLGLSEATVYTALKRLKAQGLILHVRTEHTGYRPRKLYEISDEGYRLLYRELSLLFQLRHEAQCRTAIGGAPLFGVPA